VSGLDGIAGEPWWDVDHAASLCAGCRCAVRPGGRGGSDRADAGCRPVLGRSVRHSQGSFWPSFVYCKPYRRPIAKRTPGARSCLGEGSGGVMSRTRMITTIVVGFLVSQVLAAVVHGFFPDRDYAPFGGTLLRAAQGQDTPPWQMLFLPIAHLSFISALVWSYGHLQMSGSVIVRGLTLGVFGWLIGQVPLW